MKIRVIKSNRKSISLSIDDDLIPLVRAPYSAAESEIFRFVSSNSQWIEKALISKKKQLDFYNISAEESEHLRAYAKEAIPKKVAYYSDIMNLYPTGIRITSAKKRFGSCSGRNSLSFSLYLMKFSDKVIDYVVVHELAHIRYHNHSKQFYELISYYLPDYKQCEKSLREYSIDE